MIPFKFRNIIDTRSIVVLLFLFVVFLLPGCQLLQKIGLIQSDSSQGFPDGSPPIQKIYIQSFTGQNIEQVQEVFFEKVAQQAKFEFVELLPDDYTNLKILRVEVSDYSIWEADENLELDIVAKGPGSGVPEKILRRNAIVGLKISLYVAETGKLLLRKPYLEPYQQIFVGEEEISMAPKRADELQRMAGTLITKFLTELNQLEEESEDLKLEKGYGYDLISKYFHDLGDNRIKKGNRYAQVGDYDRGIWMWQLVLFEPGEGEPIEIYRKNRAVAYFNMGVVYQKLGDLLKAAKMYSMANRINQTTKYAEEWGNTMQAWLDAQKSTADQVNLLKADKEKDLKMQEDALAAAEVELGLQDKISEKELMKSIEQNEQLLLKARDLWPLEPALKYLESPKPETSMEGEPTVIIDEMSPTESELELIKPKQEGSEPALQDDLINVVPGSN